MKNKNYTLISVSNLTKNELDNLKEILGDVSYDKIISTLIVNFYKNNNNNDERTN